MLTGTKKVQLVGQDWFVVLNPLKSELERNKIAREIANAFRLPVDEALDLVATRLTEIKEKYGSDSIGSLSSAKCTNEENYLMQKFMRAVIGTNNVDHCARL